MKRCPFCGSRVMRTKGILGQFWFFKCTNDKDCGAMISFDCDKYNNQPDLAIERFDRRVGDDDDDDDVPIA